MGGAERVVRAEAREAVLARVREALGQRGPRESAPARRSRGYRVHGERGREEVLSLFAERCRAYGASVRSTSSSGVGEAAAAVLVEAGVQRVAIPGDLPSSWRGAGIEWIEDRAGSVAALDGVDGTFTGCAAAIAETGTIILDAGARQGRRALTLVPDYHLCVVDADQVVELVPEALERIRASGEEGSPITFVSGCSATSDIELERVGGVHGPRTLELLLVDGRR